MVERLGTGAILWPKSGKYELFTKLVLGMESLTDHNLHQYARAFMCRHRKTCCGFGSERGLMSPLRLIENTRETTTLLICIVVRRSRGSS